MASPYLARDRDRTLQRGRFLWGCPPSHPAWPPPPRLGPPVPHPDTTSPPGSSWASSPPLVSGSKWLCREPGADRGPPAQASASPAAADAPPPTGSVWPAWAFADLSVTQTAVEPVLELGAPRGQRRPAQAEPDTDARKGNYSLAQAKGDRGAGRSARAGAAQGLVRPPALRGVAGSMPGLQVPSQPWLGCWREATRGCLSLPSMFCFFSLSLLSLSPVLPPFRSL